MDAPTVDVPPAAWPARRLSFIAMTAPPSIWVHGSAASNDNAARDDGDPEVQVTGIRPNRDA